MPADIKRKIFENGDWKEETYVYDSIATLTSQTQLYDIILAEFASAGINNSNLPGNSTVEGLANAMSAQAQSDGILV